MSHRPKHRGNGNGQAKARLLVMFPLFYSVSATWFINWLQIDKTPMVGTLPSKAVYIVDAMKEMVEMALGVDNWDRLVVLEHDVLAPQAALTRVANYPAEAAVVGSLIFKHEPPHEPYIYLPERVADDEDFQGITVDSVMTILDEPALHPVGAVSFGFTSIARHVLEDWPADVPMFKNSRESHDLWFCRQASKLGHKIYVDSGLGCEHETNVPIGVEHYKQANNLVVTQGV